MRKRRQGHLCHARKPGRGSSQDQLDAVEAHAGDALHEERPRRAYRHCSCLKRLLCNVSASTLDRFLCRRQPTVCLCVCDRVCDRALSVCHSSMGFQTSRGRASYLLFPPVRCINLTTGQSWPWFPREYSIALTFSQCPRLCRRRPRSASASRAPLATRLHVPAHVLHSAVPLPQPAPAPTSAALPTQFR